MVGRVKEDSRDRGLLAAVLAPLLPDRAEKRLDRGLLVVELPLLPLLLVPVRADRSDRGLLLELPLLPPLVHADSSDRGLAAVPEPLVLPPVSAERKERGLLALVLALGAGLLLPAVRAERMPESE